MGERARVGSGAAGLGAQLRALALGEDRPSIHCGQLNTTIVRRPSLKGWERRGERWEGGGGRDGQVFIWGEESLKGGGGSKV